MRLITGVLFGIAGLGLCKASARSPHNTIGDTVALPNFDGTFTSDADLNGYCLKLDATGDPNTYLCPSAADEVTLTCGAAAVWICNASGCDLAGELGSVTSLDATTESTIEAAIDTLGDISVGSISQGDDKSVCQGADTDFCCEWDTDGTEGLLCTAADCDGLGGSCTAAHVYEDSGNLIADLKGIDSITNSVQKITIGVPATSGHGLGSNDLHVTGKVEFDDHVNLDNITHFNAGYAQFGDNYSHVFGGIGSTACFFTYDTARAQARWSLGSTCGHQFVIGDRANHDKNYDIADPGRPIACVTSETDPDTDNTQNVCLQHDTNNAKLDVGKGSLVITTADAVQINSNRLALGGDGGGLGCINQTFSYTDFTDDGGASGHLDLNEQIPIGAVVQQMILHSLTGFTGDTTAVLTAGDDGGVDVDRYHSAGTLNVVASAVAGVDCGIPSGTTFHVAAVTVRLVLTGAADFGNFSAGEATISICYWTP